MEVEILKDNENVSENKANSEDKNEKITENKSNDNKKTTNTGVAADATYWNW